MRILRTDSFKRDYNKLPKKLQHRADKQLGLLVQNPRHLSLGIKKMKGKWGEQGVFEARVTRGYRFTFQIEGDQIILRRIGPHDVLKNP